MKKIIEILKNLDKIAYILKNTNSSTKAYFSVEDDCLVLKIKCEDIKKIIIDELEK